MRTATLPLALALAASSCVALNGCGKADAPAQPPAAVQHDGPQVKVPESSPLRTTIKVAAVEDRDVERPIAAPGTIEADPAKFIKVVPPLAGRITRLNKVLGDGVKVGDVLFTLDSSDLSSARNDASKAQLALIQARRDFERQKELFDADIISRKDYETADTSLRQAESDAQATHARLTQLGAVASSPAGREYAMRSPIAGRVVELNGAQGGYWNDTNASIMTVADLSTVWLVANVSERDLGGVFVGQPVEIRLNAFDELTLRGRVRYVGELLDPDTRTVKVRVAIDNQDGRLRPGMFAKVTLSGEKRRATVIPATALVQSGLYTRVFVETAPFVYRARNVTVGATLGDQVEVTGGLKAGERIVVKEGVLLND